MNKKKGIIIRLLISILIIAAIIGIGYLVLYLLGYTKISKEELRDIINETGPWGPIVYIIISFLQVTLIPIPGAITILGGNLLFGPWLTLLYSFIGMMLGSLFAFYLGRKIGRPFVNWVMGDKETVDRYIEKTKGKETVIFFFMFLLPMFPDDALCSLAGITKISTPVFTLIQIITKPIAILGTIFFISGEIIPFSGWGIIVLLGLAIISIIVFIIAYRKADKINEFLNNLFSKFTK